MKEYKIKWDINHFPKGTIVRFNRVGHDWKVQDEPSTFDAVVEELVCNGVQSWVVKGYRIDDPTQEVMMNIDHTHSIVKRGTDKLAIRNEDSYLELLNSGIFVSTNFVEHYLDKLFDDNNTVRNFDSIAIYNELVRRNVFDDELCKVSVSRKRFKRVLKQIAVKNRIPIKILHERERDFYDDDFYDCFDVSDVLDDVCSAKDVVTSPVDYEPPTNVDLHDYVHGPN